MLIIFLRISLGLLVLKINNMFVYNFINKHLFITCRNSQSLIAPTILEALSLTTAVNLFSIFHSRTAFFFK